ncbi:hypothetical protein JJN09_29500 [Pseudomonas sp. HS6]|nr:hypothetical protein [Pseudomonas sp. HS6]UQS15268.1 hypothetical protein JJN09_29500 [Pseudomonas sp. HS6]
MTVQRIVRCGGGHGAGGLADFDGDGLAVGQSDSHWRARHRRVNGRGVGDSATFSSGFGSGQLHGCRVDGVSDFGDRSFTDATGPGPIDDVDVVAGATTDAGAARVQSKDVIERRADNRFNVAE